MDIEKILLRLLLTFLGIGLFWGIVGGLLAGFNFALGSPLYAVGIAFLSLMIVCAVIMGKTEKPKDKKETKN